ncbi:uncharacterized protein LOC143783454 [Ranitomeya variabilis]|uniref:uncharacterized protein LOC143783454 n=1 Tax=Ranitomeya variabilis TaxID=490064 RepID=UPI0040577672
MAAMQSMKGTTGSDLFTEVDGRLDKLGLKWDKLTGVTTDGSRNLTAASLIIHPAMFSLNSLTCSLIDYWKRTLGTCEFQKIRLQDDLPQIDPHNSSYNETLHQKEKTYKNTYFLVITP